MSHRNNPHTLKEPPIEAIKGGYWITKARNLLWGEESTKDIPLDHAYLFTVDGLRYIEKAIVKVIEETGMYRMQPGAGMYLIYEAAKELKPLGVNIDSETRRCIMWKIAAGHDCLRQLMEELGYRSITNRDFDKYGAGGGR